MSVWLKPLCRPTYWGYVDICSVLHIDLYSFTETIKQEDTLPTRLSNLSQYIVNYSIFLASEKRYGLTHYWVTPQDPVFRDSPETWCNFYRLSVTTTTTSSKRKRSPPSFCRETFSSYFLNAWLGFVSVGEKIAEECQIRGLSLLDSVQ